MSFSLQSFPKVISSFLNKVFHDDESQSRRPSASMPRPLSDTRSTRPPTMIRENAFNIPLLPSMNLSFKAENGIFRVYELDENQKWVSIDYPDFNRNLFIEDYTLLTTMMSDGPLKSFCYRRLQYLKAKF